MPKTVTMDDGRAEGSDVRKGGRINPSAVFISPEFTPKKQPPTPLDLNGMMAKAKESGFIDADSEPAKFLMGRISYQHMCEYLDVIKHSNAPVPMSIREANRLMTIDREYQRILFEYIGLFELQFRSSYAREMSLRYGAFAHRNPKLYKNAKHFEGFLSEYSIPFKRIRYGNECRQKQHIREYGDMPIWEAVEEVSLGTLSKLYKNTKSAAVRDAVAGSFACDRELFESWTSCLTVVRNQIAHFGFLLGKTLPRQPKKMSEIDANNTNPFYVTLMLMRMLRTNIHFQGLPELMFSAQIFLKISKLFSGAERECKALGVPDDWFELISSPNVSGVFMELVGKSPTVEDSNYPKSSLDWKMN